jgi:hypothetical protein
VIYDTLQCDHAVGHIPIIPVISMGRCNTCSPSSLTQSTKLISFAGVNPNKAKPWLGSD